MPQLLSVNGHIIKVTALYYYSLLLLMFASASQLQFLQPFFPLVFPLSKIPMFLKPIGFILSSIRITDLLAKVYWCLSVITTQLVAPVL